MPSLSFTSSSLLQATLLIGRLLAKRKLTLKRRRGEREGGKEQDEIIIMSENQYIMYLGGKKKPQN